MSEDESAEQEYVSPAITRRETLETLGVSGTGVGMLVSSIPGQGPPDNSNAGGAGNGHGPPEN
jgi:hypothetical protein